MLVSFDIAIYLISCEFSSELIAKIAGSAAGYLGTAIARSIRAGFGY